MGASRSGGEASRNDWLGWRPTSISAHLQALRAAQQNHTARLTKVEDRLVAVEGTLDLVRVGVEAIHGKLDTLIDGH